MNAEDTIKTVIATFIRNENKIITIILHNVRIDKDDVVDAVVILKRLGENLPTGKLIDARFHNSITNDAKQYWRQSMTFKTSLAIAYVVGSDTLKYLANCYLKIFSPKVRMRYFTNHTKGYEWLKTNLRNS
jgi:hypothetical protein